MSTLVELLKQVLKPPVEKKETTDLTLKSETPVDGATLALELYNRAVSNTIDRKKRKAEKGDYRKSIKDPDESDGIVNITALNKLVQYCDSVMQNPETAGFNAFEELWHYLNQELFKSRSEHRMKVLYTINHLMEKSDSFLLIVNKNISAIVRSAGLLQSISIEIREKELAKDHNPQLAQYIKELIEYWDYVYGNRCANIHNMKRYLVESLKIPMPDLKAKLNQILISKTNEKILQENKILLFSEKIVQNEWTDAIRVIEKSMLTINECYQILFPRIGTNSEKKTRSDQNDAPVKSRIKQKEDRDNANDNEGEDEDEWNNIEWESEEKEPKKQSTVEDVLRGSVPFTLEISFSTAAKHIVNADNEVVIQLIREVATNLAQHHIPKLKNWKSTLQQGINILQERQNSATSSSSLSTAVTTSLGNLSEALGNYQQKVADLNKLLDELKSLLTGKCKDLLK